MKELKNLGVEITDVSGRKYDSLTEMTLAWGIPLANYLARLEYGCSEEEALCKPLGKGAYDHYGIRYGDVDALCRAYSIPKLEYDKRRAEGWRVLDILTTFPADPRVTDAQGVTYPNFGELCRVKGLDLKSTVKSLNSGKTLNAIIEEAGRSKQRAAETGARTSTKEGVSEINGSGGSAPAKFTSPVMAVNVPINEEASGVSTKPPEVAVSLEMPVSHCSHNLMKDVQKAIKEKEAHKPKMVAAKDCVNLMDFHEKPKEPEGVSSGVLSAGLRQPSGKNEVLQERADLARRIVAQQSASREKASVTKEKPVGVSMAEVAAIMTGAEPRKPINVAEGFEVNPVVDEHRMKSPEKPVSLKKEEDAKSEKTEIEKASEPLAERDKGIRRKPIYRTKGNLCDPLGNTFSTLPDMFAYYGMSKSAAYTRAKRYDMLEALTGVSDITLVAKEVTDHKGTTYPNVVEMCRAHGVPVLLYFMRLYANWSVEEALTKEYNRMWVVSSPCKDFDGNCFNSIDDMCKHYGTNSSTVNTRVLQGMTLKEALTSGNKHSKK